MSANTLRYPEPGCPLLRKYSVAPQSPRSVVHRASLTTERSISVSPMSPLPWTAKSTLHVGKSSALIATCFMLCSGIPNPHRFMKRPQSKLKTDPTPNALAPASSNRSRASVGDRWKGIVSMGDDWAALGEVDEM